MSAILYALEKARADNDLSRSNPLIQRMAKEAIVEPSTDPVYRRLQDGVIRLVFEAAVMLLEDRPLPYVDSHVMQRCARATYLADVHQHTSLLTAGLMCLPNLNKALLVLFRNATIPKRDDVYRSIELRHLMFEQGITKCYSELYGV